MNNKYDDMVSKLVNTSVSLGFPCNRGVGNVEDVDENWVSTKSTVSNGQTKIHSMLESVTNVLIGYGVATLSQFIIFPLYDIHIPLSQNLEMGIWFTVVSVVRSYILRRWFNKIATSRS